MISILIPVFNTNVVELIRSLQQQIALIKEKVEIVVMDDASDDDLKKKQNREGLLAFPGLHYLELPVNCGRNIIRHKLAAAATFHIFIFIDADSSFPDASWLQNYIDARTGGEIIMGGRRYNKTQAGATGLHFHYGLNREQLSAAQRNIHPYRSFMACNFLIRRQQLARLIIDNNLQGYCHEDTFMGLQFEKLGIPIRHIDNPVFHDGIDEDAVFISKQEEALENLRYLYNTYNKEFNFSGIKLVRVYKQITASAVGGFLLNALADKRDDCKKRVLRSYRLVWLDLWKLLSWHQLNREQTGKPTDQILLPGHK